MVDASLVTHLPGDHLPLRRLCIQRQQLTPSIKRFPQRSSWHLEALQSQKWRPYPLTTMLKCLFFYVSNSQWEFAVWCRELKPCALWQPRGVAWGRRWEGDSRERYMYSYGCFMLINGRNQCNLLSNYPPIKNKYFLNNVCFSIEFKKSRQRFHKSSRLALIKIWRERHFISILQICKLGLRWCNILTTLYSPHQSGQGVTQGSFELGKDRNASGKWPAEASKKRSLQTEKEWNYLK